MGKLSNYIDKKQSIKAFPKHTASSQLSDLDYDQARSKMSKKKSHKKAEVDSGIRPDSKI